MKKKIVARNYQVVRTFYLLLFKMCNPIIQMRINISVLLTFLMLITGFVNSNKSTTPTKGSKTIEVRGIYASPDLFWKKTSG